VPSLVQAHLHDLAALKAACVELVKASMANAFSVTLSPAFFALKLTHPVLWRDIRVALGLPEVAEEEEEEGQGGDRKRARK